MFSSPISLQSVEIVGVVGEFHKVLQEEAEERQLQETQEIVATSMPVVDEKDSLSDVSVSFRTAPEAETQKSTDTGETGESCKTTYTVEDNVLCCKHLYPRFFERYFTFVLLRCLCFATKEVAEPVVNA